MTIVVKIPPTDFISLSDAKRQVQVSHNDDDILLSRLIHQASTYVEKYTGRFLTSQTIAMYLDEFPRVITVPRGPIQSVESITYVDTGGETQTLDVDQYRVDKESTYCRISPAFDKSWPSILPVMNSVEITMIAGYGDVDDVPEDLKGAMLLLVGTWYENRDGIGNTNVKEIPFGVDNVLDMHRMLDYV